MISLLVTLILLLLVLGLLVWAIQYLPLPAPWGNAAIALVILLFALILLGMLFGDVPVRPWRLS